MKQTSYAWGRQSYASVNVVEQESTMTVGQQGQQEQQEQQQQQQQQEQQEQQQEQ